MHDEEEVSWDNWLKANGHVKDITCYDHLLELTVTSYGLDKKNRKQELKDQMQFLILWWYRNKKKFNRYKTTTKVAELLNKDHTTIVHHYTKRKKSWYWDKNVECITDFLGENKTEL
tara:strand:+ start:1460 stop:1810 length:351 start_codon:yes stop_codon:yes gene_type:complete